MASKGNGSMSGQVVWCLGMYGSASTWLFNIVRNIHLAAGHEHLQSHFFSGPADLSRLGQPGATDLVKTHEIDDAATIDGLARLSGKIFVTMRDPRDAVTSLMLFHGHDFTRALTFVARSAALCARFAPHPRAKLFQYETKFFEAPETIPAVAAHLGISLTPTCLQRITESGSRRAVEAHIAGLPGRRDVLQDRRSGDILDPQTHWHTHHAGRTGEIGRWRHMLSEAQLQQISEQLAV